jgi:glycosyltransferase involved in cell wall biosynthesis
MQVEQPLFTVATITYNSGKWVRQTIESILASTYENFELIISDDCSTDDTWEIIQQYNDPRICAWRNESNMGEYPNRNKVLHASKGKYIIYIDGDDILYKLSLGNLASYVTYFPEAGMIWGIEDIYYPNVVFPYLFKPADLMLFMYTIKSTISYTGLAEIVFKVDALKREEGFSNKYAIGDIYIKKKLCLTENVLFVPRGFAFWRHSPNQASKMAEKKYGKLIEDITIDREIVYSPLFPITGEKRNVIVRNIQIREVKLLVMHTLRRRKIRDFFKLSRKLNIPFSSMKYFFSKLRQEYYLYQIDLNNTQLNNFHFSKWNCNV